MSGFSDLGTGPYEALRRGRTAVDRLSALLGDNGGTLREVTATQVLLAEASPRVLFQEFTSAEEAAAGADWMWWWVDRDGTCFGLLAQAKILKVRGRRWTVDFGYTTKGHSQAQITKLIEAAEPYSVPAAYVLYCGDRKYRATMECVRTHRGVPCRDRERAGVSVACALVAQEATKSHQNAAGVEVFHDAVPLEDIANPVEGLDEPVHPLTRELDEELARFLRQPQRGPAVWPRSYCAHWSGSGSASSPAQPPWNVRRRPPAPSSGTFPPTAATSQCRTSTTYCAACVPVSPTTCATSWRDVPLQSGWPTHWGESW